MSLIFDELKKFTKTTLDILKNNCNPLQENHNFQWPNYIFSNDYIRRAHLDIIDSAEQKKLYMVHLCIFPNIYNTGPIFGFDLIAGTNKITGAFHDFSPSIEKDNFIIKHFENKVKNLQWSKKRDLPEWARNIFSDSMIAAGNIKDKEEIALLLNLVEENLIYYLENIKKTENFNINCTDIQNNYCFNQKKNPHTQKVMESLGYDKNTVSKFINDCLFPVLV